MIIEPGSQPVLHSQNVTGTEGPVFLCRGSTQGYPHPLPFCLLPETRLCSGASYVSDMWEEATWLLAEKFGAPSGKGNKTTYLNISVS